MKVQIDDADVSTFWDMLKEAVQINGSGIDGNVRCLDEVGANRESEDRVLEYARYLTLWRKLRKAHVREKVRTA